MALHNFAATQSKFATDQVDGLNTVGAFVNRGDASIAIMLSDTSLFDKSHTTVNLHCDTREFNTHVGAPTLRHRRQQSRQVRCRFAFNGVGMMLRNIKACSIPIGHATQCFEGRLHREQHALHIWVINDRRAFTCWRSWRTALSTIFGVLQ